MGAEWDRYLLFLKSAIEKKKKKKNIYIYIKKKKKLLLGTA